MPLTFNDILKTENIEYGRVTLIRHNDHRLKGRTLFDIWYSERELFETYQSVQSSSKSFQIDTFVASLVVTSTKDNIFVGLYEVLARRSPFQGECDPVLQLPLSPSDVIHDLRKSELMAAYDGRLCIQKWNDAINYVMPASKRNPEILEIRRQVLEDPFPGYLKFTRDIRDIPKIFPSWQQRLREAQGVYLLVCNATGEQYIGSAIGQDGFLGRWNSYAMNGHGGNKLLRDRENRGYSVSILEVAGSRDKADDILQLETQWKQKLGSRAHGLNAN